MSVTGTQATVLDALVAALRGAGAYNREDQVPPAAVLWPDRERQWAPLLPRLREMLPILTLGPYDPDARTGPAYWLRYAIGGGLPDIAHGDDGGAIPILYLPGVSKAELRAVEECPRALQPLAELQYRGVFWTHRNGRDWTVAAFLQSADGGRGIEVGSDAATREALAQALGRVADLPVARLRREAPLRAAFFHNLLNPDEARSLLEWLDDPVAFQTQCSPEVWASFCALARKPYGFDPERDGEVSAAQLLGQRGDRWATVWERFREAPAKYPRLPDLLRRARPRGTGQLPLFARADAWPQENEAGEARLRDALDRLAAVGAGEARQAIARLEEEHGGRRDWVWADLGQAPLAKALAPLARLARLTERVPGGADLDAIMAAYADWGWQVDAAVLDALGEVEQAHDVKAVSAAVAAVYRRWLADAATAFQTGFAASPPAAVLPATTLPTTTGTCLLFADGLRFDAARRLAGLLEGRGTACALSWCLGALPGVTPTAKPAVAPVADRLGPGPGLETVVPASGARVTAETLRGVLTAAGWQVLRGDDLGDPAGRGWTELGAIDAYGHEHGWKLAHHLSGELRAIAARAGDLLAAGWQRVVVVTDHGWLLLPGGLPKAELPEHLTVVRKGRCARLKPDAATDELTVPWAWDSAVRIAMARGIACYEAGKEYEHGGLSPQECVVPVLTVTAAATREAPATIAGVSWRRLRCAVKVGGARSGLVVDIRTKAGDPATSIALDAKPVGADGAVSLVVEDEEREGEAAHVVLLDADGRVLSQMTTTVGG